MNAKEPYRTFCPCGCGESALVTGDENSLLAEMAEPVACPDDVCRAQGSCAWDCGGRKYVP